MKNRRLARAVLDAGMRGFISKIEYKCEADGVRFAQPTLVSVHEAGLQLWTGSGDAVKRMHVFVRLRCGAGPGPRIKSGAGSERG